MNNGQLLQTEMKDNPVPIIISSDEADQSAPPVIKAPSKNTDATDREPSDDGAVYHDSNSKVKDHITDGGTIDHESNIKIEVKPNMSMLKDNVTMEDLRNMIVKCSSCGKQMNHHDPHRVKIHPHLKVLICKDCLEFYGTGEFSQDDDGDKYCRWCAQGGQVYGCDFCSNVFCGDCIRRNFGRGEARRVREDKWKCYVCDVSKIQEKINFCNLIIDYSKTKHPKKVKKPNQNPVLCTLEQLQTESDVPSEWLPKAFDCLMTSSMRFGRRMEKLKNFSLSGKSSNRIIRKLQQVVDWHKTDMKGIMEKVNEKSNRYKKMNLCESIVRQSRDDNNIVDDTKGDVIIPDSEMPSITTTHPDICPSDNESVVFSKVNTESNVAGPSSIKIDEIEKKNGVEECDNTDVENIEMPIVSDVDENFSTKSSPALEEKPVENKDVQNISSDEKKISVTNDDAKKLLLHSLESDDSDRSTIPDVKEKSEQEVQLSDNSSKSSTENMLLSPTSSDSEHQSAIRTKKRKYTRVKKDRCKAHFFSKDETFSKEKYENDEKLQSQPVVMLTKLCIAIPVKEPSAEEESSAEEDESLQLEKTVDNLLKMPSFKQRNRSSEKTREAPCPASKKKNAVKVSQPVSSSGSWTLSSEDEVIEISKPIFPVTSDKNINDKSKDILLAVSEDSSSDIDIFSGSSGDDALPSKKRKLNVINVDSPNEKDEEKNVSVEVYDNEESNDSEDFVIQKPKKGDRLLNVPLGKETDKKDKTTAKDPKTKKRKRLMLYSDESNASKSSSSSGDSSSSSDSAKKKGAKKKRRRIKTADDSSDEDKDKDKGTPKGRRNIRKVLSDKKLTESTKEAQEEEKERRRRIAERQKLYNKITENSTDGLYTITTKMVLEVDQDSKEEIVQIQDDLVSKLKPHQINGVKFMWESTIESVKYLDKPGSGCILAHCMGLGKTLQVITFLHTILTNKIVKKKIRTALVICPYNTVLNWSSEFFKWLEDVENEINVFDLNFDKSNYDRRDRLEQWHKEGGVMILGYNLFTRLAEGKLGKCQKKLKEAIMKLLCDPGPDIVVCDEGHMLKNENSALSKAANKLKTARRIVLTGTPLQNNLKEYHCMMHFVKPNLLGTLREFSNRFVNPIINGQYDNSSQHDVKRMKKRVHILHKLLEGCVQRCDYSALTKYLPPKHEFVISVKLSEIQINLYKYYLENFSKGQTDKVDGGKLFQDFKMLKLIWTYPYLLYDDYYRQEKSKLMKMDDEEEEAFIDDSNESSSDDNKTGTNKKEDESSDEEVVRTYKTRSRAADSDAESLEDDVRNEVKHWWSDDITEDVDKFKIEMSGKIVLLLDILKHCESIGDKVLVFSTSLLTLNVLEDVLQNLNEKTSESETEKVGELADTMNRWVPNLDYFRMDGNTNADVRKKYIETFNDPEEERARLFLISTKAGSLGTNLIGANRVVLMDASWNPSHDVQAIFRVYRFGQLKPVYVYRLLAQGTMEEKIYNRQVTKLSLSCRVVDEQQIDRHYNAADLQELYTLEVATERPTPMVPKDRLLADILIKHSDWIVKYHEHDSLLQSSKEDDLTEEERRTAWTEYENEKDGIPSVADMGNDAYSNLEDRANVDLQHIIHTWTLELQKNPSNIAVFTSVIHKINVVRNQYQSFHTIILRNKKAYISKNEPVPQQMTNLQINFQRKLEQLNNFMQNVLKIYAQLTAQQQPQHRPTYYRPQQPTFTSYGQPYSMRPPNINYSRFQFPYATGVHVQKEKPKIVDITSEKDVSADSTSMSTPIITEVEDVKSTEAPSSSYKSPSVEITEIE